MGDCTGSSDAADGKGCREGLKVVQKGGGVDCVEGAGVVPV